MASAPWSYSFWASTMMKTLSEGVGLEGGTPRRERNDLPDWGGDILDGRSCWWSGKIDRGGGGGLCNCQSVYSCLISNNVWD